MEHKNNRKANLCAIFLTLSFLFVLGLVGAAENGGSMLNLLWAIPVGIVDFAIIEKEMY